MPPLAGFLTTFVLLARDQFKPSEMVDYPCSKAAVETDLSTIELDLDQGFLWLKLSRVR
jgi:hypothetical protein